MSDKSWKTHVLRQAITAKIDETIKNSGTSITNKSSFEIENHFFKNAKSKEEYLAFVARLILHVREMDSKTEAVMNTNDTDQNGLVLPDLINALQNLAS